MHAGIDQQRHDAGLRMVSQFVATLCVSALFGRLNRSLPLQGLMVAGYALLALGLLLLTQVSVHTPYWIVGSCFALLGCGAGLAVPATSIVIMGMAPAEQAGAASATTPDRDDRWHCAAWHPDD
ncbi:hypothetical protein [Marinobacter sp. CA1]|uniref:hypothetical protein n=1 Tax=Marinobacter sp. CA1 TaxID=2817656 RepID=UPI001D0641F7|nr:hypothetical protein [Marinobacter sp. CA1]UDL06600.1 hypothetical protein J2887_07555 [Marinobacter sp. CA1]